MKIRNIFLFMFLILCFKLSIYAQVTGTLEFQVSSTQREVIKTGLTELMGDIKLNYSGYDNHLASYGGGSINITYDTKITNNISSSSQKQFCSDSSINGSGGIDVCGTGFFFNNRANITFAIGNTSENKGRLIITLPPEILWVDGKYPNQGDYLNQSDYIIVKGVRTSIVGFSDFYVTSQFTSQPPRANLIMNLSQIVVAITSDTISTSVVSTSKLSCNDDKACFFVKVSEGGYSEFAQYISNYGAINQRAYNGETVNSQIHIRLSGGPNTLKYEWPIIILAENGPGTFNLLNEDSDGNGAVFEYKSKDSIASDGIQEVFNFKVCVSGKSPNELDNFIVYAQAQLYPNESSSSIPRYKDPLSPSIGTNSTALIFGKCGTLLLFPYVTSFREGSEVWDTGLSISNTTSDPWSTSGATPEDGNITLYFYDGDNGLKTEMVNLFNLQTGRTWRTTFGYLGNIFPSVSGKTGYIMADCGFRGAHGYAFIVKFNNEGTDFQVSQSYLALVLKKPRPAIDSVNGEGLNN